MKLSSVCALIILTSMTLLEGSVQAKELGLKDSGQEGVDRFVRKHGQELKQLERQPNHPRWRQLNRTLDRLCQQKDCYASQLYWYKDFDRAKQAAQKSNKPILSLRLLGNLDEELSCANSRFFRIALYSNPEIAKLLKERYILHWQSVRPAPKLTIDYGDGRKIQQTITGNSVHYILDAKGQPIDALPGLYSPQAFASQLTQLADFVSDYRVGKKTIERYHTQQLERLQTNWQKDLATLGIKLNLPTSPTATTNPPTALEAGRIAVTKSMVELPIVRQTRTLASINDTLKTSTNEELWQKLGNLYRPQVSLAANSRALMQRKQPQYINVPLQMSGTQDQAFNTLVDRFEAAIAIDSIQNEYLHHSQIHQWFLAQTFDRVDDLNDRVYDRLFLTPKSDPWLGLVSGSYNGIERGGRIDR
jgi:hypothetical protein